MILMISLLPFPKANLSAQKPPGIKLISSPTEVAKMQL
jgi:hypothetical protein